MAEFQTVMRQFERLCNSADRNCSRCKLNDVNCSIADIVNNSIEFEKRVMEWAAEHPEPVYPTWLELAVQQGFKIEEEKQCTDEELLLILMMASVDTPIPAEIAQKLGIEPKEVR